MGLEAELELLRSVPMAKKDNDGHIWHMPIEGQHVFIAGRTGGGKNSWTWTLVLRLILAWLAGLVKFWGLDPKKIELAIGRGFFDYYANTDESMVELLEQCVKDMQERMDAMQGVARVFTPSPATPLNVIIVDELAYLSSYMPDKKLRDRADKAVRTILTQGRAPGYALVGTVQDVRVETVGFRNQFPLRICGGLNEARQVDMVLGDGAYEAGARCNELPLGPAGAGMAYVWDVERSRTPLLVRAPRCSDEAIKRALADISVKAVKDEPMDGHLQSQPGMQFKVE